MLIDNVDRRKKDEDIVRGPSWIINANNHCTSNNKTSRRKFGNTTLGGNDELVMCSRVDRINSASQSRHEQKKFKFGIAKTASKRLANPSIKEIRFSTPADLSSISEYPPYMDGIIIMGSIGLFALATIAAAILLNRRR